MYHYINNRIHLLISKVQIEIVKKKMTRAFFGIKRGFGHWNYGFEGVLKLG